MNQATIIVPMGIHLLELIKHNPVNVVAAIDCRNNGALEQAGIDSLTQKIYKLGLERPYPLLSIRSNCHYYRNAREILDRCIKDYPDCRFIISGNYVPFSRFLIDHVGVQRVELWEDGLNHYIRLESMLKRYWLKEMAKIVAGYYRGGMFDHNYQGDKLTVRDRFVHQNLSYPISKLKDGGQYYIGQPLIEDSLISERHYRLKLEEFFSTQSDKQRVIYLLHPREKKRAWLYDIFDVEELNTSAETYLQERGASIIYSAFSTVNVNVECDKNIFLARYLGLDKIAAKLTKLDFQVELV